MKCVIAQEKLAATSVTDMLSLTESQLEHRTADCGTTREETHRLVLAVSNLRHCIGLLVVFVFYKNASKCCVPYELMSMLGYNNNNNQCCKQLIFK